MFFYDVFVSHIIMEIVLSCTFNQSFISNPGIEIQTVRENNAIYLKFIFGGLFSTNASPFITLTDYNVIKTIYSKIIISVPYIVNLKLSVHISNNKFIRLC